MKFSSLCMLLCFSLLVVIIVWLLMQHLSLVEQKEFCEGALRLYTDTPTN